MEKRYNLSEVAQELGFTRQGLYYWIKKGWDVPKRDYKMYTVFMEVDLKKIKKWKDKLEEV
jgi:DNA-binding transcriptional MerR regulator